MPSGFYHFTAAPQLSDPEKSIAPLQMHINSALFPNAHRFVSPELFMDDLSSVWTSLTAKEKNDMFKAMKPAAIGFLDKEINKSPAKTRSFRLRHDPFQKSLLPTHLLSHLLSFECASDVVRARRLCRTSKQFSRMSLSDWRRG